MSTARTQAIAALTSVHSQSRGSPDFRAVTSAALIVPTAPTTSVRGSLNSELTSETYISLGNSSLSRFAERRIDMARNGPPYMATKLIGNDENFVQRRANWPCGSVAWADSAAFPGMLTSRIRGIGPQFRSRFVNHFAPFADWLVPRRPPREGRNGAAPTHEA
jgi:hypothetical protein